MNSPKSIFQETDLTQFADQPVTGLNGVSLVTKRGKVGINPQIFTSWAQFQRHYGGFIDNASDPAILQAKRALEGGSGLRVNRLNHYTDTTDADSFTADYAAAVATNIFVLASAAAAGHTLTYTSGAAVAQAFDTDGLTTMKKLAAKIKAGYGTINDAIVLSATRILIVPSGAAIAGDTLVASGVGAPATTRTTSATFKDSAGNDLFVLTPKYPGLDYNNLKFTTSAGSNGQTGYWDLKIEHILEPDLNEVYRNIIIPGSPTVANSKYLDEVKKKSQLVAVTYNNLSAIAVNPIVPIPFTIKVNGGTDGDALVAADIIGDSAGKTGFYAFDGSDDISGIAVLMDDIPNGVHQAGAAYAEARKDLQYFIHVGDEGDNEAAVIAEKDALGINSSYVFFTAGMLRVIDPQDSQERVIPELGDVLALSAYSETNFGPWLSFSGYNRGRFQNLTGVGNEWGSPGNSANLDALANHQINVAISRNKTMVLWGSFTGQIFTSQLSLGNIRRLHIYIKKALGPVLEQFIEEPCDIPTFKQIFIAQKQFMDPLIPKRAIYDYRWEGDQFCNTIADCKINDPNQLSLGNYKAQLFVKDIASMQEIRLNVTLTPAGVAFEDALEIVQPNP